MADLLCTGEIEYQVLPVFVQLSDQDSPDDFRSESVMVSLLIRLVISARSCFEAVVNIPTGEKTLGFSLILW
jgi:hypothetical protein